MSEQTIDTGFEPTDNKDVTQQVSGKKPRRLRNLRGMFALATLFGVSIGGYALGYMVLVWLSY